MTLGTSPGWADIYPPAYPEQWIDVTGLRGCFAYVHIADPENGIYEANEDNNEAQTIVRLPFRERERRRGCRGSDRGPHLRPHRPLLHGRLAARSRPGMFLKSCRLFAAHRANGGSRAPS